LGAKIGLADFRNFLSENDFPPREGRRPACLAVAWVLLTWVQGVQLWPTTARSEHGFAPKNGGQEK
jgi:hypothetical protein